MYLISKKVLLYLILMKTLFYSGYKPLGLTKWYNIIVQGL